MTAKWFPAHFANAFLRAVGQPAFVNNPICGAIIFASLVVQKWHVGLGCLLGGSVATAADLVSGLFKLCTCVEDVGQEELDHLFWA